MRKHLFAATIIGLLACGIIFVASFSVNPTLHNMSRDGGAFAYCGWRITTGDLLYRDCWDNKPPAIYYVNAAAIALGGAHTYSLWLAQAAWLSLTTAAFYLILRLVWGGSAAALSSLLMLLSLLHPTIFENGNLTETYALLPITLTLGCAWGYLLSGQRRWLVGIGLLTATAFLLKPTYISAGLAISLVLAFQGLQQRQMRRLASEALWIFAGFALPLLLVGAYWWAQGELDTLVFAVFIHNRLYVQEGFSLRAGLSTLRILLLQQPLATVTVLGLASLAAWGAENWRVFWRSPAQLPQSVQARLGLMLTVSLMVLLDVLFTAISGKNFLHYFQIPLLSLAAGSVYLFHRLSQARAALPHLESHAISFTALALISLLPWAVEVAGKELPDLRSLAAFLVNPISIQQYQPEPIEVFILENSTPAQSILVWDYDPGIYFNTGRRSPTRYIFLRHLFTPLPGSPNGFAEFMQELQADPPELIITSKNSSQGLPYLGQQEEKLCIDCAEDIRLGVLALKHYLNAHYQAYTDIQTWAVYRRVK